MGLSRLKMPPLHNLLRRLKPGVSHKAHLLTASVLWTSIGLMLTMAGTLWLVAAGKALFMVPAVVAGIVKSLVILDNSAEKGIERIRLLAEGSCLGAVYSKTMWLLVLGMMAAGYLLRHSHLPAEISGSLYVAVGCSLLYSSRIAWIAWSNMKNNPGEEMK